LRGGDGLVERIGIAPPKELGVFAIIRPDGQERRAALDEKELGVSPKPADLVRQE